MADAESFEVFGVDGFGLWLLVAIVLAVGVGWRQYRQDGAADFVKCSVVVAAVASLPLVVWPLFVAGLTNSVHDLAGKHQFRPAIIIGGLATAYVAGKAIIGSIRTSSPTVDVRPPDRE